MITATWIIIFILILSVVIFVHELGHFLAARRAGIFVEEFALGMGPKLIQFKGKKPSLAPRDEDEEPEVTLYTLRILPIGGYCKMRGQDEDVPEDPEAMNNKPVRARLLVIAGGSLMNFLLAFVLFFGLIMLRGHSVAEVVHLQQNAPGHLAGLQVGDRITHVNGARVGVFEDLLFLLDMSGGQELEVRVNRGGERINLQITPAFSDGAWRIGFHAGRRFGLLHDQPADPNIVFQRVSLPGAVVASGETILSHIRTPFRLLARLFTGQQMPDGGGVMGPIGIGEQVVALGQQAEEYNFGFLENLLMILSLTALLNAALGIMNLLPIPALDGARLVFLVIEGIRRKPVPPEREAVVHLVGLVAILALAVFIAYRDIMRIV
ncbi:MAG: site-2 protease family protein [Defluviitaleaceae bacterium]|nr:site-2 protease family protein [Defluviitaleaceae bacterium]